MYVFRHFHATTTAVQSYGSCYSYIIHYTKTATGTGQPEESGGWLQSRQTEEVRNKLELLANAQCSLILLIVRVRSARAGRHVSGETKRNIIGNNWK